MQKGPPESPVSTVNMVRSPIKKPAFRMLASTFARAAAKQKLPAVSALESLHANRQWQAKRKAAAVMDLVLSAYPTDSPYAVNPTNTAGLAGTIEDADAYLLDGVPDSTASHERSAWNRYWVPFCAYVGMKLMRPPDAELNPVQLRFEDTMKGVAAPCIYSTNIYSKSARARHA